MVNIKRLEEGLTRIGEFERSFGKLAQEIADPYCRKDGINGKMMVLREELCKIVNCFDDVNLNELRDAARCPACGLMEHFGECNAKIVGPGEELLSKLNPACDPCVDCPEGCTGCD